jgi:hypothetical protein
MAHAFLRDDNNLLFNRNFAVGKPFRMSADPPARLCRLGRRMAWLVTALFWSVLPGLALYVLVFPGQLPGLPWVAAAGFAPRPLPAAVAGEVIAALWVVSLPGLFGLWQLKRLFESYARGEVFTAAAARRLRRCGYALIITGAESPFGSLLLSAALSLDLPPGRGSLVVTISSNDLLLALIGGVVLVISQVMVEAARIAEDNAGFV